MNYISWYKTTPDYWWTRTTSTSNNYRDTYRRWVDNNIIHSILTANPTPPKPEKFLSDDLDKVLEVKLK